MLVPSANGEYTIAHPALVMSNADRHSETTIIIMIVPGMFTS